MLLVQPTNIEHSNNDSLIFFYFEGLGDLVATFVVENNQFVGPSVHIVNFKMFLHNSSVMTQSLALPIVVVLILPFCRRLITMSGRAKILGPPQQNRLGPLLIIEPY